MVLQMATTCRRASSQTTRSHCRLRGGPLKTTAWLCRLEHNRPARHVETGNVLSEVNTVVYWKLLQDRLPQVCHTSCCVQLLQRFSLWIWYTALFPHSLSSIMNQTARRKHSNATYSYTACHILTEWDNDATLTVGNTKSNIIIIINKVLYFSTTKPQHAVPYWYRNVTCCTYKGGDLQQWPETEQEALKGTSAGQDTERPAISLVLGTNSTPDSSQQLLRHRGQRRNPTQIQPGRQFA